MSISDVNLLDSALDVFLDFLDMNKSFRKTVFSKWWVRLNTDVGLGFEKFNVEPEKETSLFTTSPFVEADDAGFYKKKKRYKLGTINNANENFSLTVPVELDSFYKSRVSLFSLGFQNLNKFINSGFFFNFFNFFKLEVMPNDFGLIYT
jgi:hypothetical protein